VKKRKRLHPVAILVLLCLWFAGSGYGKSGSANIKPVSGLNIEGESKEETTAVKKLPDN
jgi:hypothetical protein